MIQPATDAVLEFLSVLRGADPRTLIAIGDRGGDIQVRTFERPVIIPQGFGFRAVCETVNLQFRVSMFTVERPAERA